MSSIQDLPQKLTLQRILLYECFDYILELKEELEKKRRSLSDEEAVYIDLKNSIWDGLYGYMAQKTLDLNLPPYCFKGNYEGLLKAISEQGEEVILQRLNNLIKALINYVDAHRKAEKSAIEIGSNKKIEIETWQNFWVYLISKIEGVQKLANMFSPSSPKKTATILTNLIDEKKG